MKRFWIALGILCVTLAFSGWGLYRIDSVVDGMSHTLDQLQESVEQEDAKRAQELSEQFLRQWQEHQSTLERYIHHESLDQITGLAAQLSVLASYQEYALLSAQAAHLEELLYHVREAEFPNLGNIF